MRNPRLRNIIMVSGLSATAAFAAQPTDNVSSDSGGNTAMGSNALKSLGPLGSAGSCKDFITIIDPVLGTSENTDVNGLGYGYNVCGSGNTAAGQNALTTDTSGHQNTAVGFNSMNYNTTGYYNTAVGANALFYNSKGISNTAVGSGSLFLNTTGYYNTAVGAYTLTANSTGIRNSAFGAYAQNYNSTGSNNSSSGSYGLYHNTTGSNNSALGTFALEYNTTGHENTAGGALALEVNMTGANNVAFGYKTLNSNNGNGNTGAGAFALQANTTGGYNAAFGYQALYANTTGGNNTAFGRQVLAANTTGFGNAGQGFNALLANITGYRNTAVGNDALQTNVAGIYNSAFGFQAGLNINGSYNIDIGNTGVADDHNTIRIGATSQVPGDTANNVIAATYIAGIYSSNISGTGDQQVFVATDGRLVTHGSSERFKTDIAPMSDVSAKLAELRPVTFRYRSDQSGTLQYGLIAEDVAKVSPELVIRDDSGRIQGVHYEELAPMLVTEVQNQQRINSAQAGEIEELKRRVEQLQDLQAQMLTELARMRGAP